MKTILKLLVNTMVAMVAIALTGCWTNDHGNHTDHGGTNSSRAVTNIVVVQPPDQSFAVGDNVKVTFTAQGCSGAVAWTFKGLPTNWTVQSNMGATAVVSGESPVGSSVQGISIEASASCGTNKPFTTRTRLTAKAFVKELPPLNHPVETGAVWAKYSVNLGRNFFADPYVQSWATVGVDTEGLIKTDGIQLVSADGNVGGRDHTLDQVIGQSTLSVNPRMPFESGEQFDVEPEGFKVFGQHPFHIRLFFVDRSQNDPDRYKRRDTHRVGLIRVEVK
jgi:hypothetical protein